MAVTGCIYKEALQFAKDGFSHAEIDLVVGTTVRSSYNHFYPGSMALKAGVYEEFKKHPRLLVRTRTVSTRRNRDMEAAFDRR